MHTSPQGLAYHSAEQDVLICRHAVNLLHAREFYEQRSELKGFPPTAI